MTIDPREPRTGLPTGIGSSTGTGASDITRPLGRPFGGDRPSEAGAFSASVPQAGLPTPAYSASLPGLPTTSARPTNAGSARVFHPTTVTPPTAPAPAVNPASTATAESKLGGVRAKLVETADSVLRTPRKTVNAHPMAALGVGVGVGLGAGLLLGRLLSR